MAELLPLVVSLSGSGDGNEVLGGKAAALDRLIGLGYRVPRCAALTTAAYTMFVADPLLSAVIETLRSAPVPDPAEHATARDEVDHAFLSAPMPEAVAGAITALGAMFPANEPLALRSSATAEDLGTASFAGQYRTFLRVSPSDFERSIRLIWASLWHPAPRTYRAFRGIDDSHIAMAVLAMAMIEPITAGVLFTRDPAGSVEDIRLEAVEGLGESLVSGARTPEALVFPRNVAIGRCAAVNEAFGELVERALALEATLERPQDIEWAIDSHAVVWFLQARPVTGLTPDDDNELDDGFDVRHRVDSALTTAGISEMLPGVLPPLVWEAVSWQVEDGFRSLFDTLGAPLDGLDSPHALVARLRGRAAMDLDHVRDAAASIPGGSADELERRYFGEVLSTTPGRRSATQASPWQGMRLLLARQRAALESEIVIGAVARLLDTTPAPDRLSDQQLLAYRTRVHDLAARNAAAEISIAAFAAAAYRGVESVLAKHLGDHDAATLAQQATRTPMTGPRTDVARTFHTLITDPTATALLSPVAGLDWDEASAVLRGTPDGALILDRWGDHLRRAGCTAVFGGPVWEDSPDLAWFSLRSQLSDADDPRRLTRREEVLGSATDAETVIAQLRHRARSTPFGPAHRRFLRREIADATELLERRERTKAALLMLGGIAHRIDNEIGRRLTLRSAIEAADDVRLLSDAELVAALTGAGPTRDVIARRRRRLVAATAAGPLPRLFRGAPESIIAPSIPIDAETGWGASPGVFEGPARVVDAPATGALRRGDVLVARSTDASWAPLFLLAGAIVVEEGGPLSHAAIVARELGVPAVVNVPGIVERVRAQSEGAHLTVDGTRGTVRIHSRHPADETPAFVTPRTPPEPNDLARLHVFVTGLIGAGVLLSALVSVTEAVGSARGARRIRQRATAAATNLAAWTAEGHRGVDRSPVGLRSARWYAWAAAVATVVALAVSRAGFDGYIANDPISDLDVVWLAVAAMSAVPLVIAAAMLGRAALTWPDVAPVVRRLIGRTRAADEDHRGFWSSMPSPHRALLVTFSGAAAVLMVLVVVAEPVLLAIDEPLYNDLGLSQFNDPWAPEWFGLYFGRPQIVVPAALAIALITFRCRVLALAYPLAIVFGGATNLGLGLLVGRQRPPLSDHALQTDSFPSGGTIEVTLLLGLAPLAIAVLLRSNRSGHVARVIATSVLAVMLADGFRSGSHWPSDHLAGFLLAMTAVVFVHALARMPSLHDRCNHCPAVAITANEERAP